MIFLTVGSQLPFDRLVRAMDHWCASSSRPNVIGQIGNPGPHGYLPRYFKWETRVTPEMFEHLVQRADLLVAHAGMGSIISALTYAKPIVIMPRRAALGETRNDHQRGTAERFRNRPGIFVAEQESSLPSTVDRALLAVHTCNTPHLAAYADQPLLNALRCFIVTGAVHAPSDDGDD